MSTEQAASGHFVADQSSEILVNVQPEAAGPAYRPNFAHQVYENDIFYAFNVLIVIFFSAAAYCSRWIPSKS